jgi:hypothetical protein
MTMQYFAKSFIKRAAISLAFLTILDFLAASNVQAQAVPSPPEIVEVNAFYYGGDLRFSPGSTFYDVGNLFTEEPLTGTMSNQFFNGEARVGYTFKVVPENQLSLAPFLGYGY